MMPKAFSRLMLTENLTNNLTVFLILESILKDKTICEVSKCQHLVGHGVSLSELLLKICSQFCMFGPSMIYSPALNRAFLLHFIHLE